MFSYILLLLLVSSPALGELYQINETNFFCPMEEVAFRCVSPTIVSWQLNFLNGDSFTAIFDRRYNLIGESRSHTFGIAAVTTTLDFINASQISALVLLNNATMLDGMSIACNQDRITFTTIAVNSVIEPPVLSLTQLGISYKFLISWQSPVPRKNLNSFTLTIEPAQVNGISNILTNDASAVLTLDESFYNITIDVSICSGLKFNRKFTAGKCPFLMVHATEIIYDVDMDGSAIVNITCVNGKRVVLECRNNFWENYFPRLCEENDIISTKDSTDLEEISKEARQSQQELSIIAGVCAAVIVVVLMSSIMFILGCFCRKCIFQKEKYCNTDSHQIYEEVHQVNKNKGFDLTTNSAYGEINKSNFELV